MLLPVSNINFGTRFKKPQHKNIVSTYNKPYEIKSLWDKNNISFTAYIPTKPEINFNDDTVDNPWYYKLPTKTLKDGTIYKFKPDKTQKECASRILKGDSVVYCAPTGTGKTAVAHFCTSLNLEKGKETIITVPMVALANDKFDEFKKIYGEDKVGLLTGADKINTNAPIKIMTAEILYNQAQDLKHKQNKIGTIIIDEAHYISDESRGNAWESAIIAASDSNIQLLCLSATIGNDRDFTSWIDKIERKKNVSLVKLSPKERYVPLSWKIYCPNDDNDKFKTILDYKTNLEDIDENNLTDRQKRGLKAILQKDETQEAEDDELKKALNDLRQKLSSLKFDNLKDFKEELKAKYPNLSNDSLDEITYLLSDADTKFLRKIHQPKLQYQHNEFINDLKKNDMLPAIFFNLSVAGTNRIAKDLATDGPDLNTKEEKEEIKAIIEKYKSKGAYFGSDMDYNMLYKGYASHNSYKLNDYKKLVEELFSKKLLKVVAATSTLSTGIDMPAKTVVISDVLYQKRGKERARAQIKQISVNDFHQMAGRAGRRGIYKVGNVVLYNLYTPPGGFNAIDKEHPSKRDELDLAYELLMQKPDNLRSNFKPDSVILIEHLDNNPPTVSDFIQKSFKVFTSKNPEKTKTTLEKKFNNYTRILLNQGFITKEKDYKDKIEVTPKGKILKNCQGANPMLLASLMYDESLKDITPEQLIQIAASLAGSDEQVLKDEEQKQMLNEIMSRFKKFTNKNKEDGFINAQKIITKKEWGIIRSINDARGDVIVSNMMSGFIAYLFAYLNQKDKNPIANFETIANLPFVEYTKQDEKKDFIWKQCFNKKLHESAVYKTIVQTITVLKQMSRICDYALERKDIYSNSKYWTDLKDNTAKAIEMIKKPPAYKGDI